LFGHVDVVELAWSGFIDVVVWACRDNGRSEVKVYVWSESMEVCKGWLGVVA